MDGFVQTGIRYSPDYRRRLQDVTDLALDSVPAYRAWRDRDIGGHDILSRLAALPVLDKEQMRAWGPEGFADPRRDLRAALARGEVEIAETSGSTADRVRNVWCQAWWDASEEASWQLNAHASRICGRTRREAILASPLCVGFPSEHRYLERAERTVGRFLFLNERVDPCAWTPGHMDRMIGEINAYQPAVIEANPSYLAHLCRYAARENRRMVPPGLVVLTYDNPSVLHRRQIRAVLDVPIVSSYGSTEAGYVFMECERGRLHQNTAFCHVDYVPFSSRHRGPGVGAILVTTFHNPWRVLVRFDLGDVVRLAEEPCPCGRCEGITLASIEGRGINCTLDVQGAAVTQAEVDRRMAGLDGLEDYQLVQEGPALYVLRVVCPENKGDAIVAAAISRLTALYGEGAEVQVNRVENLPPDPPGKFRLCKPLFPLDTRTFR